MKQAVHEDLPIVVRRLALGTILISVTMAVLDGTIANVALPTISRQLDVTPAASIWIVNSFQFAVTAILFTAASLGGLIGFSRMWRTGLVIFTISSLLCALSHNFSELVASRILQGSGAAMILGNQPSILRLIYPPRFLGRGIGWVALTVATSSAAGPTIGGAILAVAPWQWLFLVNVPLGIAALLVSLRTLPPRRTPTALRDFDAVGAVCVGIALTGFAFGMQAFALGSVPRTIFLAFLASLAASALYVRHARRFANPLLPLDVFARPSFTLSALTSICSFLAQGSTLVSLPFFFQIVLGRSALEAGLLLTPWPLSVAFVAPIAGRLADRYPVWILATSGLATMALGAGLLAVLPAHPSIGDIVWREIVCGLGFGFFQSPNNRELLSSVPREQSGAAGGMLSTARLFGQSLGAAFVAAAFGFFGAQALALGGTHLDAIARATPVTLWFACGVACIGAIISSTRRRPPQATNRP